MKYGIAIQLLAVFMLVSSSMPAQNRTVGVFLNSSQAYPGYTLFAPKQNTMTYLIDNEGRKIHEWSASTYPPGQSVYLLENGNLLRTCMVPGGLGTGGGEGGRIEEYDWNDSLVWQLDYSTISYKQHHDIRQLPDGNILMLVVEKKTYAEVIAAGFDPARLQAEISLKGYMLPDCIIEIDPTPPIGGDVVWEWHVWDHLIQDYDPSKANYGVVNAHPELVDADGDRRMLPLFWNHMNCIDYNPSLDQIALSVRGNSEVWIIDHSTTTAEAAGHTGGAQGKGGDLLYRWGNPLTYGAGTLANRKYFEQHNVEWVRPGYPGEGNLTCFNNGLGRNPVYSTVDEITPPVDTNGGYALVSGTAFGPVDYAWTYQADPPASLYSTNISGAQRMPNGNTLICEGGHGDFTEVTPSGEIVWKYLNPVVNGGPLAQGDAIPVNPVRPDETMNSVFRIYRYPENYAAFDGRDLNPGNFVESYPGGVMVLLPEDTLSMGDHFGFVDPDHPSDETPIHPVKVDSFYMATTETTNGQFLDFLNSSLSSGSIQVSNNKVHPAADTNTLYYTNQYASYYSIGYEGNAFSITDFRAAHPVVGVTWKGSASYCNWLSRENGLQECYDTNTWECDFTKNGVRLPTEAEWEYAGRGGQNDPYLNYPKGNSIIISQANLPASGDPYETGQYPYTTPAGFYDGTLRQKSDFNWPGSATSYHTTNGVNGFGLFDMQGNVWEFVNDWYGQNYYSVSPYDNPAGPDTGTVMPDGKPYKGMRGGNWYNGMVSDGLNDGHSRVSNRNPSYYRGPQDPSHPWYHVGFRIARNYSAVSVIISASPSDTACQGSPVTFTAVTSGGGSAPAFQWKVNGSDAGNNSATITYIPSNGDLVSCILTSSMYFIEGNPDTSNQVSITVNTSPVADFTADKLTPQKYDTVHLTDLSTGDVSAWNWSFDRPGVIFVNGTNALSQNPQVVFTAGGLYSISLVASNPGCSDSVTKSGYLRAGRSGLWSGEHSSEWNSLSNWDNYSVPDSSIDVIIPSSAQNWPVFDGNLVLGLHCRSLTLEGTDSRIIITGETSIP